MRQCIILVILLSGLSLVQFAQQPVSVSEAQGPSPAGPQQAVPELRLPLKPKSVRFAAIGDSGSGSPPQYEVAHEMQMIRAKFPFDFVIMCGDNINGGHGPGAFREKFAQPYKGLLDAGVKFYASLGNHDNPNERFYKLFNMKGKRYYSFRKGNVTFFALDSNYMDPVQLHWLKHQLKSSNSAWKICFFHHPLYSDGRTHGPDMDLRAHLEPIFMQYGVNAVFSGHDHVYERIKPQKGIYYFVEGNSGELRYHNLRPSAEMAAGFDTDRAFMLVEIAGDELYFQTISRMGATVDSGVLHRQT